MPKIKFPNKVEKTLKKIPAKEQKRIFTKIETLRIEDKPRGSWAVRDGSAPYRRFKTGNYRFICSVEDDTLHIAVIDKRNNGRDCQQIS